MTLVEIQHQKFRAAQAKFHDALVKAFPVGSQVSYRHGYDNRVATVLRHSQDRMQLIGTMGVEYWKYWDSSFVAPITVDEDKQ